MNHVASPDFSDKGIERILDVIRPGLPRVTMEHVQAAIASEHYFTAANGVFGASFNDLADDSAEKATYPMSLSLLTICVLVLRNGFTVTGESACAHPEMFDAEIGRKIARAHAEAKIWPLLGYGLKSRLAAESALETTP